MKIKVILLFASIFLVSSLSGSVIKKNKISMNGYFIQIAVLKNISNISNVKKNLKDYDLFIQDYKNLKKIYVVNIKKKSELLNIKKIYPTAFITRKPKNINQNITKKEMVSIKKENGVFEIYSDTTVPISDIPDAVILKVDSVESEVADIEYTESITIDDNLSNTTYHNMNLDDILNEKPKGSDLDSNTILKTRKSFL
jgi:hypothetical protein